MNSHSMGYLIRHYREIRGVGLTELARKIGVSKQTVWNWENLKRQPSIKHLIAVSKALDVDLFKEFEPLLNKEER